MASSFGAEIDYLRTESRLLLTSCEKNAQFVNEEVKKLRRRYSSPSHRSNGRRSIYDKCSEVWKLRNGSGGVEAALRPDYFRLSPKYESVSAPDMNSRRLLIKSGRKQAKPSPPRKSVKDCYCYATGQESRKIHYRSPRTKHKPLTIPSFRSDRVPGCGDGAAIVSLSESASSPGEKHNQDPSHGNRPEESYSPPLSSATLKRAQRIDYTPRSLFLRRVQSKINEIRNGSASTSRSPSPSRGRSRSVRKEPVNIVPRSKGARVSHGNGFANGNEHGRRREKTETNCQRGDGEIPKAPRLLLPKKTICSKKSTIDRQRSLDSRTYRAALKSPPASKRIIRVGGKDDGPRCSRRKEGDRSSRLVGGVDVYEPRSRKGGENAKNSTYGGRQEPNVPCPCSQYEKLAGKCDYDGIFEEELNDIRKFRDINYFDTHASDPMLLAAKSSDTLLQFRVNERLFPEHVGTIERGDLVVSIPPCATRQKRSIHYFPRSVVRQEKTASNANCLKKRRCTSCPLTGHSVDLGALKIDHPTNSLALRFQKGIP